MSERASVWLATAEAPVHAPLAGDAEADVTVVGAGITGLTTALLLQRAGARVLVVDAGRVASGTTGGTTGKVTSQHEVIYRKLLEQHGERKARLYAEANQEAIAMIEGLAGEVDADCGFQRSPAFVYTQQADERATLEAEHAAAVQLGLPATLTTDIGLPVRVELALRFDDQAHFHAVRYMHGLARAFVAAGGRLHEQTRAVGITENEDHAVVHTEGGDVRSTHVVVATLIPFVDRGGFFAKQRPTRSYGVAARLRSGSVSGMQITVESPTRSTRPWDDGGRPGVIVVGEDHPTGHGDAAPGRWGALEEWARAHFEVESFEYRWSAQDFAPVDSVPYVGRSPRMRHTFVATGFSKWGLTNGTAAAAVLAELLRDREHPWLELFDATRIGDGETVKKLVGENLHVGKEAIRGWAGRLGAEHVAHLEPGEGGQVKVDGRTVGAYREPNGAVRAVSLTCTHMGCTVAWNGAEHSWDCPCHGSRFGADGSVLSGPAVRPLEQIEVDDPGPLSREPLPPTTPEPPTPEPPTPEPPTPNWRK